MSFNGMMSFMWGIAAVGEGILILMHSTHPIVNYTNLMVMVVVMEIFSIQETLEKQKGGKKK